MEKKVMSPVTRGLLIALVLIVLAMLAYFLKFDQQSWYRWSSQCLFVAAIIWGCIHYSNQMNNNVTFGGVFGYGFKTTAVITIFMVVFTAVILMLIPEIKEKALEMTRQEMEKRKDVSEDQIDMTMRMMQKSFLTFAIAGVLLVYLVVGCIGSLLGAAFAKKNPNPNTPFDLQDTPIK